MRLYTLLAKGAQLKRIYIDTFFDRLDYLFSKNILDRTYFAFKMLDGTHNHKIDAIDISDLVTNFLHCPAKCHCPLA